MNNTFTENFRNAISLENVKYFYHVTNKEPELILSEGLFMVEDKIYTTAIEIPEEFKKDPIDYCENEKGREYRKDPSIILIAVDKDELDYLIQPIIYPPTSWTHDVPPNFYIAPKYILGYINTDDYELIVNEEFDLGDELYMIK